MTDNIVFFFLTPIQIQRRLCKGACRLFFYLLKNESDYLIHSAYCWNTSPHKFFENIWLVSIWESPHFVVFDSRMQWFQRLSKVHVEQIWPILSGSLQTIIRQLSGSIMLSGRKNSYPALETEMFCWFLWIISSLVMLHRLLSLDFAKDARHPLYWTACIWPNFGTIFLPLSMDASRCKTYAKMRGTHFLILADFAQCM